ncbi:MAG: DUF4300 family protein [Clostridia bacterium]
MKKQSSYLLILALIITTILLLGCSNSNQDNIHEPATSATPVVTNQPQLFEQAYSNLVTTDEQEEVKENINMASLSNADVFLEWVQDYNDSMDEDAGLAKTWSPLSQVSYQSDKMLDSWDKAHNGVMDSNCRLVAFLLLQNNIQSNPLKDYGSYLMMDVDEIENNDRYSAIKDDLGKFIALFNQVSVANLKEDADYLNAFQKAWTERGVVFPTGKASMISVVMNDSYDKVLFIGHTGVLIEEEGYLLFIEKLSPNMPYQVTRYADRETLSATLLGRPEYTLGDEDFHTFLLENDKVL